MEHGERIKALEVTVERLEHAIDGNGRPGLLDTVTRIDTGIRVFKWVWVGTIIPLAAALLYEVTRH